ncbi:hypothetical protein [Hymenobacter perfusus]|uniref:Uncharacterized protein n=1 Tax=Hymenobacter perfusus TaxID=1236770 RepID=A0A3R9MWY9_9BACT|nr:hypothetical protein [Hymenobacter perfusus]RSK42796.1 hypothetical protein EI293_13435 [Hymenobacter perfusus]
MKIPFIAFYSMLSLMYCSAALGQSATASDELTARMETAQLRYAPAFPNSTLLYSGPEYIDYSLRYSVRTGHQYFTWPEKQPGTVTYNGEYFDNLSLAYDTVLDQVILSFPNSPFMLRLINENVSNFTINEHYFTRIVTDSSKNNINTGYYEVLNSGNTMLLARRTKKLQKQITQKRVEAEFSPIDKFYICNNGTYYFTSSKGTALRAFSENAPQIQEYIKSRNLKFNKKNIEKSLLELCIYHNSSTY